MDGATLAAVLVVAVTIGLLLMKNSSVPSDGSGGAPASPALTALATAIAAAENVPASANNPGALVLGDLGNGLFNSAGVSIFSTFEEGFNALVQQLQKVEDGAAKYLKPDMTLSQFAATWTGNDNAAAWAATVAGKLGVSVDTTIGEILGNGD